MGTPSFSNLCNGPHSYCGLRMFMNALSLQASAYLLWLSGRVLWRKWRKLAPVSPVAELLDRMVLLLGVVDAVYYIPCMLVLMQGVSPLLILYSPGLDHEHLMHTRAPSPNKPPGSVQPLPPPAARSGGEWTFVWPHCREVVMTLNILLHCYMAWMLRQWVVKKRTASQLLSEAPRLPTLFASGLGVVLVFVAADNVVLHYFGMAGMAWTALALDLLVYPACVLYLLFAYFTTAKAMRGSGNHAGADTDTETQPETQLEPQLEQEQQEEGRQLYVQGGGKHARMRRRLVRVGVATGAAWVFGSFTDTVVWASALHSHAAPIQAYPARLVTCRLIGVVDALVLAGAVDALCDAIGAGIAALAALLGCRRQTQRRRQRQQHRSPLSLLVGAAAGRGQRGEGGADVVEMDQEMALVKQQLQQQQQQQGQGGAGSSGSSSSSSRPSILGGKRKRKGGSGGLPTPLPLALVNTASLSEPGQSLCGSNSSQRSPLPSPASLLRVLRSRSLDALGFGVATGETEADAIGDENATVPATGVGRGARRWRSLVAALRPPVPRFGGRSRSQPLPLPSTREGAEEEGKDGEGDGVAHVLLDLERIVRGEPGQEQPASPPLVSSSSGSGVPSSLSNVSSASAFPFPFPATAAEARAAAGAEAAEGADDPLFLATLSRSLSTVSSLTSASQASSSASASLASSGRLRLWLGTWDLAGASLGCGSTAEALAQLQAGAWVPVPASTAGAGAGPDVYVLGLQRCASVRTARALRRALGRLLQAPAPALALAEYALVLSVGAADDDKAKDHGGEVHAVVVAARRALLESGAVALLAPPGDGDAMVGLRLQDAACAFVAAAVQPKSAATTNTWQAHHHYPWCEEGDRLLARALHKSPSSSSSSGSVVEDAEAAEEARLWEVPSRYTHTVLLGSFHTRLRLSAPALASAPASVSSNNSSSNDSSPPSQYQGWSWVAQGHDTLARALAKGHLLPGFVEAPLRNCPPSYPYPARGRAGGKEAEAGVLWALDGWMRTIATLRRRRGGSRVDEAEAEAAERLLPSYPARILVHSLPAASADGGGDDSDDDDATEGGYSSSSGSGSRLRLGAYALATLVTGSPYKPVAVQATLESAAVAAAAAAAAAARRRQHEQQPEQPKPQSKPKARLYEYALELRGLRLEDGEEFGPLSIAGATLAYPLTHLDQGHGQGQAGSSSNSNSDQAASAAAGAADPRVDRRVHALAQSRLLSVKVGGGSGGSDGGSSGSDGDGGGSSVPSTPLAAAAAVYKRKLAAAEGFGDEGEVGGLGGGEGGRGVSSSSSSSSSSSADSSGSTSGWRAALWGGEAQAHCLWRSPDFFDTPHDMVIPGLGDRGRVVRGAPSRAPASVSAHGAAQRAAWGWGMGDDEREGLGMGMGMGKGEGEGQEQEQEQEGHDGARVLRHAVVVAVPEQGEGGGAGAGVTPVRLRQAALRLWALRAEEEGAWRPQHRKGHRRVSLLARHAAQETLGQAGFLLPDLAALGLSSNTPVAVSRVCLPLALHGRRTAMLSFQLRVARRPLSDAEARSFAGLPRAPAREAPVAAAGAGAGAGAPLE